MSMVTVNAHFDPEQVEVETYDDETGGGFACIHLRADASRVSVFMDSLDRLAALEAALTQARAFLSAQAEHDRIPNAVGAV